ncbi:MAG: EFR1 family ferrodoxin [Planctomycetaceae bacterium]|jgi:ferredoxin/flavodoxin|nr:EFR1 family ferrodoxin [Planctomycetaceae bacterium]
MTNMMTGKKIHLYWFSGSGNTLRVARTLTEELRLQGVEVQLRPIENFEPKFFDSNAVLGLAFPTHFFTLPIIVRDFVTKLPNVHGTPAFMLTTAGMVSGGVHGPLKRLLSRKGFHCVGTRQLMMPDSYFAFIHGRIAERMIVRAERNVRKFADRLLSGQTDWRRVPVLSDLIAAVGSWCFARRNLFKTRRYPVVYAKEKKCVKCNICRKFCPVDALTDSGGKPPQPTLQCTLCLRCVAVCPNNAMRLCFMGLPPYRALTSGKLTSVIRQTLRESDVFRETE